MEGKLPLLRENPWVGLKLILFGRRPSNAFGSLLRSQDHGPPLSVSWVGQWGLESGRGQLDASAQLQSLVKERVVKSDTGLEVKRRCLFSFHLYPVHL